MKKNHLKAMSKRQLAALYGVDPRTLFRWLKPYRDSIGEIRGTLTPKQITYIFSKLGMPNEEI
jgi:transposase-like protein